MGDSINTQKIILERITQDFYHIDSKRGVFQPFTYAKRLNEGSYLWIHLYTQTD